MPQAYSPAGQVGTSIQEATVAEAATGTHGQTFMKDNLETLANKVRFLQDSGQFSPANLLDLTNAAAGQIGFPASQNASAGANVLDDYEEGTWTPTDASGAGLAFTIGGTAIYEKFGRLVIARVSLTWPATGSGANAVIGGLPFTSANNSSNQQCFVTFTSEATAYAYVPPNTATIGILTRSGSAVTNATMSSDSFNACAIYSI